MRTSTRYTGAGLVFLGGSVGTLLRYLVGLWFSQVGTTPGVASLLGPRFALDTLVVNLVGALLLGITVGFITAHGPPTRSQLRFRLFFGTGAMGGFTTYSTFALQTSEMVALQERGAVASYALATVIVGAALSAVGLLVGRRMADTPRKRPSK